MRRRRAWRTLRLRASVRRNDPFIYFIYLFGPSHNAPTIAAPSDAEFLLVGGILLDKKGAAPLLYGNTDYSEVRCAPRSSRERDANAGRASVQNTLAVSYASRASSTSAAQGSAPRCSRRVRARFHRWRATSVPAAQVRESRLRQSPVALRPPRAHAAATR